MSSFIQRLGGQPQQESFRDRLLGAGLALQGRGAEAIQMREQRREKLSKERMQAAALDLFETRQRLAAGDIEGARNLVTERIGLIGEMGGDPSDTQGFLDLMNTDPAAALADADIGLQRAAAQNFIELPEGFGQPRERTPEERRIIAAGVDPESEEGQRALRQAAGLELSPAQQREQEINERQQAIQLETAKLNLTEARQAADARREAAVQAVAEKDQRDVSKAFEAQGALDAIDALLENNAFEDVFGGFQGLIPSVRESSVLAEAQLDQISALLELENRQKLKGQGTITDNESQTLARSASILGRRNISDEAARRELERVRDIFVRAKQRATRNPTANAAVQEDIQSRPSRQGRTLQIGNFQVTVED